MAQKRFDLLLNEIDPRQPNALYIRENFRRLKYMIDGLLQGTTPVGTATVSYVAQEADIASLMKYEAQIVTSDGQTAFVLENTPEDESQVRMIVNSCELINGVHFTVSGKNVTFLPAVAEFEMETLNELGVPDQILFQYVKA